MVGIFTLPEPLAPSDAGHGSDHHGVGPMGRAYLALVLTPCGALRPLPSTVGYAGPRVGTLPKLPGTKTAHVLGAHKPLISQTPPETRVHSEVDGWLLLARAVLKEPAVPDSNVPLQKHTTCATATHSRNRRHAPSLNREPAREAPAQASRLRERLQRLRRLSKTAAGSRDRNQMVQHRLIVLCLVLQEPRAFASPIDFAGQFADAHAQPHEPAWGI